MDLLGMMTLDSNDYQYVILLWICSLATNVRHILSLPELHEEQRSRHYSNP